MENESNDLIDANMWLSVRDTAMRVEDDVIAELASKQFNAKFDFEQLLTENKSKSDQNNESTSGGRKIKR